MASINETGHSKNVANFENLISFVTDYGSMYNPSKSSIKLTALQDLCTSANNSIGVVNNALAAYRNAIADREVAFNPLSKLVTRIINALKATDTTVQVDESAKILVRKIQGKRATPKKSDEEKAAEKAAGKETKEISSSQMSFDNRLDNFDKLIKLLTSVSLYAPNEEELKITALTSLYSDLKSKNLAVINASTTLSNARIARDNILYKVNVGMIDLALDTKSYIKSIYGATSPQYKQVSKLRFKSVLA
jgi:hypothetical protein